MRWKAIIPVALAVVALAVSGYFYLQRTPKLTDKDTIVLADFENKTGDGVFDDALKQALAVELGQSPFLNVLSDRKVSETLRMIGPSHERTHYWGRGAGALPAHGKQGPAGRDDLQLGQPLPN
jgi:hypothetical protein